MKKIFVGIKINSVRIRQKEAKATEIEFQPNEEHFWDVLLRLQSGKLSNLDRFRLDTFKNQLTKECAGGDSIKAHRHNLTD